VGEHTEKILLDQGKTEEEIIELKLKDVLA
jgi:hypothetical protein